MAEAENKQETNREFKPLSRLIGGTRNNLAKVVKMFLVSFSTYHEHSMHENPFTPFSMMLLTGPTCPIANRLAKKMNFHRIRLLGKTSLMKSLSVPKWYRIFIIL